MAQRRMISKKITETDLFLDMPPTTQNLYFHLNMNADDDGFVGNPNTIRRNVSASPDDFRILEAKQFIINFESGILVIKHWKMHNYIRTDRYSETEYKLEKSMLTEVDNKYEIGNVIPHVIPHVIPMVTTGKDRLGEDRLNNTLVEKEKTIDYEKHFDEVWKLYPNKKGKGAILKSKTKLKRIYENKDILIKCIERYVADIKAKGTAKQFIQNGSTFFNTGWMDYTDDNYEKAIDINQPKKKAPTSCF